MSLNIKKNPLLYSAGTSLAYKIAKRYYSNIHFVWCTTEFDSSIQPPTSNPASICKRYLEQIVSGDRHTIEIKNNIAGILRGAKVKLDNGVITKKEYNEIRSIVSVAKYEAFLPVLFIIESKKVKDKYIEVEISNRASDKSIEYKIEELKDGEYRVIQFDSFLSGVINVVDKKVGD